MDVVVVSSISTRLLSLSLWAREHVDRARHPVWLTYLEFDERSTDLIA